MGQPPTAPDVYGISPVPEKKQGKHAVWCGPRILAPASLLRHAHLDSITVVLGAGEDRANGICAVPGAGRRSNASENTIPAVTHI